MEIQVDRISGFAYLVTMGEHELVADQPVSNGGEGFGPTPTDLFVAGLVSCAAYYAGRFLARRGSTEGVGARGTYRISTGQPARVESIEVSLDLPPGLSDEVRAGALRSAEHCTVHNSLTDPLRVTIAATAAQAAA